MRLSQLLPVAVVAGATAVAMSVGGINSIPLAQAATRITVPGAGPLYFPNIITELPGLGPIFYFRNADQPGGSASLSILQSYDAMNHAIGQNWAPGTTAQVVNYPASMGLLSGSLAAPSVDSAVATGHRSLDDQIMNATAEGQPVVVASLSMGTLVVNRELEHLATDTNAPAADTLRFVSFGSPEIGLANIYLPAGATVPLIGYTTHRLPDSQYDIDVVLNQYDGWADPPDRPWNLLSVVNALFGIAYYHNNTSLAVPSDAVEVSRETSSLGGTTTTYVIPSPTVPLLKPLQQLGVPKEVVGTLNSIVKPMVDAGYSSLTPDAGPYFSQGQLVGLPMRANRIGTPAPSASPAAESVTATASATPADVVGSVTSTVTRVLDGTKTAGNLPALKAPKPRKSGVHAETTSDPTVKRPKAGPTKTAAGGAHQTVQNQVKRSLQKARETVGKVIGTAKAAAKGHSRASRSEDDNTEDAQRPAA